MSVFSLKGFVHLLSGSSVKWFTDNQAVPLRENIEIDARFTDYTRVCAELYCVKYTSILGVP